MRTGWDGQHLPTVFTPVFTQLVHIVDITGNYIIRGIHQIHITACTTPLYSVPSHRTHFHYIPHCPGLVGYTFCPCTVLFP